MSVLLGKGFTFDFRRTDGLRCAGGTTTNGSLCKNCLLLSSVSTTKAKVRRTLVSVSFNGKRGLRILAEKEDPKVDKWDQMELKFGRLPGEDPKLTLAKIMGRKANPEASYLEIEKSFYKKKGKIDEIKEVPFDVSEGKESSNSTDGLNLVRPVPKKGFEFKADDKPVVSKVRKPTQSDGKMVDSARKRVVPNVILRKPTVFNEDDAEDKLPRFRFKPNLSLKMWKEQAREKFSDITLLRKPEPGSSDLNLDKKQESSYGNVEAKVHGDIIGLKRGEEDITDGFPLLEKPKPISVETQLGEKKEQFKNAEMEGKTLDAEVEPNTMTENNFQELVEAKGGSVVQKHEIEDNSVEMQLHKQSNRGSTKKGIATGELSDKDLPGSGFSFSVEAALQGKPKRLDKSVREASSSSTEKAFSASHEDNRNVASVSLLEDVDWSSIENLLKTGEWTEVELISSSNRGFVVSFGSLVGFLPYRNLAAKWRFLNFKTWLRQKGLDPANYKQNLGVLGSYDVICRNSSLDSSSDQKFMAEISPDTKLEDLLRIYDQEKLKFLSSFVSQRIKVNVEMAERKSRKLMFSLKPKEKKELIEKRRNVMATLRVGDAVKCNVKKITDFGIFVEVEGVPALIHQTEVLWDDPLDPASFFKVGQILEAKVHQLDFALERIFLSLKEMTPDPLVKTLESVVGGHDKLDGRLETAQADTEGADVESLIKELQQVEGIKSVSKGPFFLSPGLAPTFQVYMASMFENQYKLLARSGNKVQEVIVQTSLSKEEMKSTILSCTNRVE